MYINPINVNETNNDILKHSLPSLPLCKEFSDNANFRGCYQKIENIWSEVQGTWSLLLYPRGDSSRVALDVLELHNSSVLFRGGSMKKFSEKF